MTSTRHFSGLVLLSTATWLVPQIAWAGDWYIRWDCVGACAGYGAGNSGIIGPFPNEDECEHARHTTLSIPDDSLFRHYCEPIGDSTPSATPPLPATGPHDGGSSIGSAPQEIELSSMEFGLLAGPGWGATEGSGTTSGRGTVGLDMEFHTGPPYAGATFQLGVHGTRLVEPLIGEMPRSWFVLPASVGMALTPRLLTVGARSLWLDLGASVVGFTSFGCGDCPVPVFSERFGYGWQLEAGLDLMMSEETGFGLDLVVPRFGIGAAVPGDLRLTSPLAVVRVSVLGRPSP
jgi:hypothetical protein